MKKLGCAKCGGSMKKMQKGGSMKTTVATPNTPTQMYGIPQTGPTGPNYQGIDTMKKGGMVKKQDGGPTPRKVRTAVTSPSGDYKSITTTKNNPQRKSSSSSSSVRRTVKGVINNAPAVKAAVRPMMQKNGGAIKKMAKGGSTFGMLSVKAGVDKNPKPTAADRIVGAKKKAKFGASVPVQHSPAPGRVRSSSGVGTVPVGARKKMGGTIRKKK